MPNVPFIAFSRFVSEIDAPGPDARRTGFSSTYDTNVFPTNSRMIGRSNSNTAYMSGVGHRMVLFSLINTWSNEMEHSSGAE